MFSPIPQVLPINVKLHGDKIEFSGPSAMLLKYVDVKLDEQMLKDDGDERPKAEQSRGVETNATKSKDRDAGKQATVAKSRSLEIVAVYRVDRRDGKGEPLPLPRNSSLWLLEDVRTLEAGSDPCRKTEARLFKLTFQGNNLRQDPPSKGGQALLMALLEQAEIRLRVLVDKKCFVVLRIKPTLSVQAC